MPSGKTSGCVVNNDSPAIGNIWSKMFHRKENILLNENIYFGNWKAYFQFSFHIDELFVLEQTFLEQI